MDTIGICILGSLVLFAAVLIRFAIRRDRDWRQFAHERHGTFQAGNLGSLPTVSIELMGRQTQISQPRLYGSERGATEIRLEWPGDDSLEIKLVPKLARFLEQKPGPEISLEGHALAESHLLYGTNPDQVQRYLTPTVLASIANLDALWHGCKGLKFVLTGGQLTILKPGVCWHKTQIEELTQSLAAMYMNLLEAAGVR